MIKKAEEFKKIIIDANREYSRKNRIKLKSEEQFKYYYAGMTIMMEVGGRTYFNIYEKKNLFGMDLIARIYSPIDFPFHTLKDHSEIELMNQSFLDYAKFISKKYESKMEGDSANIIIK